MKTKEEVKKSRSQEVEESRGVKQEPTEAPSRSRGCGGRLLNFSTSRLFDSRHCYRWNEAGMSMKTKGR